MRLAGSLRLRVSLSAELELQLVSHWHWQSEPMGSSRLEFNALATFSIGFGLGQWERVGSRLPRPLRLGSVLAWDSDVPVAQKG